MLAEFGAVAAVWSLIQQTGLIELVDAHVPKRSQGPTVGQYLAVAVVNRVVCPKSKQKIGRWFAKTILLVSTDFHVPLFHETYEGNRPDAVEFRSALAKLQQRWQAFLPAGTPPQDMTVVFDKGNNSAEGFEMLDQTEFHFVGSLCPTQHPDLLAVPHEAFEPLRAPRLEQVSAYRTTQEVFGAPRTIVVTFNDNLYTVQLTTLTEQIGKARRQLDALSGAWPDTATAGSRARVLLWRARRTRSKRY